MNVTRYVYCVCACPCIPESAPFGRVHVYCSSYADDWVPNDIAADDWVTDDINADDWVTDGSAAEETDGADYWDKPSDQ